MFIVFEISKPFQIKPGFYRSEITVFRVWWLWFALNLHPGRYDEMLDLSASGVVVWDRRTPRSERVERLDPQFDVSE